MLTLGLLYWFYTLRQAIKILCTLTTSSPDRGVEWEGINKQTNKRVYKSANAVKCNINPPEELSLGEKNVCSISTILCFVFLLQIFALSL